MDELTNLGLTLNGFRMIGEKINSLCELCDGKEIDLIASGYNRTVLPHAWLQILAGINNWKTSNTENIEFKDEMVKDPLAATEQVLFSVKKNLSPYWDCLL